MQTSLGIYLFHHTKYKKNIITQQRNNMTPKFACGICAKAVAKNHSAVLL